LEEVRRGDEGGETKGERSEVGLVERGLTTDQAAQVVEGGRLKAEG
jgi:hypothetical protein